VQIGRPSDLASVQALSDRSYHLAVEIDPTRQSDRGYYMDACYKLFVMDATEDEVDLGDGPVSQGAAGPRPSGRGQRSPHRGEGQRWPYCLGTARWLTMAADIPAGSHHARDRGRRRSSAGA
jgi:hypothetical protein